MKSIGQLRNEYQHLGEEVIDDCKADASYVTGMSYDGRIPHGALENNFEWKLKAASEKLKGG